MMNLREARAAVARELALARAAIRRKPRGGSTTLFGDPAGVPPAVAAAASQEPIRARFSLASIGTHTLVAGMSGKRIGVYELMLWNVGAQDLEYLEDADSIMGPLDSFPAAQGMHLGYNGEPHWILNQGKDLKITTSAADQVSGFILYRTLEV